MKSTRIPIDNCPHSSVGYDEVAEQEYCTLCGFIFPSEEEGWLDAKEDEQGD